MLQRTLPAGFIPPCLLRHQTLPSLTRQSSAGETAKNKSRDREEPANAQFHGLLPTADRGPPPARTADPSILIDFMDSVATGNQHSRISLLRF